MDRLETAARQVLEVMDEARDDVLECHNEALNKAAWGASYAQRAQAYQEQLTRYDAALLNLRETIQQRDEIRQRLAAALPDFRGPYVISKGQDGTLYLTEHNGPGSVSPNIRLSTTEESAGMTIDASASVILGGEIIRND